MRAVAADGGVDFGPWCLQAAPCRPQPDAAPKATLAASSPPFQSCRWQYVLRRQHPHLSRSFLTSNVDLQELARHRTLVNSSQLTGAFDQSKRERSSKLS
jgi:hypothetical protein